MVFIQSLTGKKTHMMTDKEWDRETMWPRSLCNRKAPANGWIKTEKQVYPLCENCRKRQAELRD